MVQLMPLHPKTLSSLASFKSRLVLLFRFRLTQVVLEKRIWGWGCLSRIRSTFIIKYTDFSIAHYRKTEVTLHVTLQRRCAPSK